MINIKEAIVITIVTLVLALVTSFSKGLTSFPMILLFVALVLLINILTKKVIGFYLESDVEMRLWDIERRGFKVGQRFQRPFPAGFILPILASLITLGNFIWMACLVFDVRPKTYRAAKRHSLYSFSEITEHHLGLIAAGGILANLVFAVVGYLIGYSDFARLGLYYAFFNMLPISDLDGNKIFFGNLILWSVLSVLVLIGLGYAFFLV